MKIRSPVVAVPVSPPVCAAIEVNNQASLNVHACCADLAVSDANLSINFKKVIFFIERYRILLYHITCNRNSFFRKNKIETDTMSMKTVDAMIISAIDNLTEYHRYRSLINRDNIDGVAAQVEPLISRIENIFYNISVKDWKRVGKKSVNRWSEFIVFLVKLRSVEQSDASASSLREQLIKGHEKMRAFDERVQARQSVIYDAFSAKQQKAANRVSKRMAGIGGLCGYVVARFTCVPEPDAWWGCMKWLTLVFGLLCVFYATTDDSEEPGTRFIWSFIGMWCFYFGLISFL